MASTDPTRYAGVSPQVDEGDVLETPGDPIRRDLPVAVIGAGPIGLAAAVHLAERGERPLVLEAGDAVGATIRRWGHVRMFSPWSQLVDPVAREKLEAEGWEAPDPEDIPTGRELVEEYLEPLTGLPAVQRALRPGHRVVRVGREGADKLKSAGREARPFELVVERSDGGRTRRRAKAVLDASGTFHRPNPLGANGLPADGEDAAAGRVVHGVPRADGEEGARYAGSRVAVVGNGDTALNALLALDELARREPATRVTWVVRGEPVGSASEVHAADALPERLALRRRARALADEGGVELIPRFPVRAVRAAAGRLHLQDGEREIGPFEWVVGATGSRPDLEMLRELRLALDSRLECPTSVAPLIDPEIHTCETVAAHGHQELQQPEPGFYVLGMKSYGRAPGFLLNTGYEQVRSVTSALVGDMEGAKVDPGSHDTAGACSAPAPLAPARGAAPEDAGCCG